MKKLGAYVLVTPVALLLTIVTFGQTPTLGPRGEVRTETRVPEAATLATVQAPVFVKSPALMRLRGPEAAKLVGKKVALEGFYYDGSIPMIVDDIQRVLVDMVMPPDSYVPIVGPPPKGVKSGDRISLKAKLERPARSDPASVQRESTVLRLTPDTTFTLVKKATLNLSAVISAGVYHVHPGTVVRPTYYAVLIAGGWNSANNHLRYWNDLKTMYTILRNAGYPATNIYVLYADGVARDASMPVNFPADTASISTVFTQLGSKMKWWDTLYIMLNDHGSPNALCLWNETTISSAAFAAEVNKVAKCTDMIIQMKQCFNGSFQGPLTAARRIVMASCAASEVSYGHSSNQYGEFTFWYFAALTGSKPDGSGSVNADTNGDGKISILEAYNFARSHDTAPETPSFEDDGVVPGHSGAMPAGGDGVYAATIFLQ
jgi:hypothetical protein